MQLSYIRDFKKIISIRKNSDFPEIAKDIFAFSNYGAGWILLGWEEVRSNVYVPVGLPNEYDVDQATLQEKFNAFSENSIELMYTEFNKNNSDFSDLFARANEEIKEKINSISTRFAVIYIPPSYTILKPNKIGKYNRGNKERTVFSIGDIFYRRGTQSITPNKNELEIMNKRIENENYRISVLSGEPDQINETINSNLFRVTKIPKYVYLGKKKDFDDVTIKVLLKQLGVFPEWLHKFKDWNSYIVTFEDLTNKENVYRRLVLAETIKKIPIEDWLKNEDKRIIIIEILNREIKHYSISNGLHYFEYKNKIYYALDTSDQKSRRERWKSRYRHSTKTVAAEMYAEQLGRYIYWHVAFSPDFLQFGENNFYFRILPSFVITENGIKPITGQREGTIITRLSYNKYNSSYFNSVLFWMHQLGNGRDIQICDYLTISSEPLTVELPVGIIYDTPSSESKSKIDEYLDDENLGEDLFE